MKNMTSRMCRQSGLSLLEAALALAVLGLIISGIWALSSGAFASNKKNRLAEQVITSVETIRSYLRNTDLAAASLTTDTAWQLGLLPNDLRRGGAFRHAYGDAFSVTATNATISITLNNIPSDACVDLLYSRLGGSATASSNLGFRGYSRTGGPPLITNFSFSAATTTCPSNTNLLLVFNSR